MKAETPQRRKEALPSVLVDARWLGDSGIGRYASEIIPRLTVPWVPLTTSGSPSAIIDVASPARWPLGKDRLTYSPGFNAGVSRCRQLVTVHDLIHLRQNRSWRATGHRLYYDRILRPAVLRMGVVLTGSESSAAEIRAWLAPAEPEVVITGYAASGVFQTLGPAIERRRPFFVYVGNLKQHKNAGLALRALRELPEHDLVMVTSNRDLARQLADEADVSGQVEVVSGIDDSQLARLYRGARALAFPSTHEGYGLPALEALRCGTNVVYLNECRSVAEICGGAQFGVPERLGVRGFAEAMAAASASDFAGGSAHLNREWGDVARVVDDLLHRLVPSGAR